MCANLRANSGSNIASGYRMTVERESPQIFVKHVCLQRVSLVRESSGSEIDTIYELVIPVEGGKLTGWCTARGIRTLMDRIERQLNLLETGEG